MGVAERPVASISALQQLYFTDPTGIYTAGRALGVAAGTATIAALYGLAARLTDHRTAIAAAIFLAVSPLHVRDSHYVKHDVPATLAVVLAYLAMTRVWPCARAEGPRAARHARRGRGLRRRVLDPLLLRVPGHSARARRSSKGGKRAAPWRAFASWFRRRREPRRLLRAVAVSARRAAHRLARYHGQPPNRHRSRRDVRRVRTCGPLSRDVMGRRGWPTGRTPGPRRDAVDARGGARARDPPARVPGSVSALHRQHGPREPLPQPRPAVSDALRCLGDRPA